MFWSAGLTFTTLYDTLRPPLSFLALPQMHWRRKHERSEVEVVSRFAFSLKREITQRHGMSICVYQERTKQNYCVLGSYLIF